jgi:hypothetical protein
VPIFPSWPVNMDASAPLLPRFKPVKIKSLHRVVVTNGV